MLETSESVEKWLDASNISEEEVSHSILNSFIARACN